jgi:hypothetical protein
VRLLSMLPILGWISLAACGSDGGAPPEPSSDALAVTPGSLAFTAAGPAVARQLTATVATAGTLTARLSEFCDAMGIDPVEATASPTTLAAFTVTPLREGECSVTVATAQGDSVVVPGTVDLGLFTIASDVAPGNSDTGTPGDFALVHTGDHLLAVYCRRLGTPLGLVGTVMDASGQVLRSFAIGSHDCNFPSPSIAVSASGLLVVFQRQGAIVGTRLTGAPAFDVLGETAVAPGTSNYGAVAASDGVDYVVAWQTNDNAPPDYSWDIFAARVSATGQVSPRIAVYVQPGEQVEPALAFNGTSFLVVWRDTPLGSGPSATTDIRGARVSKDGTLLDPAGIDIATAPECQGSPSVASDGVNQLVVWLDGRNHPCGNSFPGALEVYGARVSPDGALLDGPSATGGVPLSTVQFELMGWAYLDVVFDGSAFDVALALDGYESSAGIYLTRVSPEGRLLDGPADRLGPSVSGAPRGISTLVHPAVAAGGGHVVAAWVDNVEYMQQGKDIVAAVVTGF